MGPNNPRVHGSLNGITRDVMLSPVLLEELRAHRREVEIASGFF